MPDRDARRARLPSQPLARDLEIIGLIIVHLFAATDGPDADFTAKLIDVFPGGTAGHLCDDSIRGRYRKGHGRAEPPTAERR